MAYESFVKRYHDFLGPSRMERLVRVPDLQGLENFSTVAEITYFYSDFLMDLRKYFYDLGRLFRDPNTPHGEISRELSDIGCVFQDVFHNHVSRIPKMFELFCEKKGVSYQQVVSVVLPRRSTVEDLLKELKDMEI